MEKELKQTTAFILFMVLVFAFVLSTIVGLVAYSDQREFKQQIQCKEVSGTYTYENNTWVCR